MSLSWVGVTCSDQQLQLFEQILSNNAGREEVQFKGSTLQHKKIT